jgi:hypothetical protein
VTASEPEETYWRVDPLVLKAARELAWLHLTDPRTLERLLPTIVLCLRILRVDEHDRLVLNARVVRDLLP